MTAEDVIRTHTEGFNRALTTHDLDALSRSMRRLHARAPGWLVLGKEDVLRDLGAAAPIHVDRSRQRQRPDLRPDSAPDR